MSFYLAIEICAFIFPLIFSFDKNLQFYKNWKSVLLSLIIIGSVYIAGDIYFTKHDIWGFNPVYHSNIYFFHLPLEEWFFFITIPYASIFLHYTLVYFFPDIKLSNKFTGILTGLLILILMILIVFNYQRIYTFFNAIMIILALILAFFDKAEILNRFYISFLIILIPFFVIDAILTGSFIQKEVLWYNDSEILGIRILTIPIEDIGFAFSLILFNLLLISRFQLLIKTTSNHSQVCI
jgi:lycopene cyclase domain-containing protein